MVQSSRKPSWQLPPGVTRGVWDYVHSELIAEDYDDYFSYSPLFEYDLRVVREHIECATNPIVADLGCGTGRTAIALAQAGARVVAIDLSEQMLNVTLSKADAQDLPVTTVRANLVELTGIADTTVDHAVCLFSTLGMIQRHQYRQQTLGHIHRILKPSGKVILHVHNVMANVSDPGGLKWLLGSLYKRFTTRNFELGDKHFSYRGLPSMFLHTFSARELKRLLRNTQFQIRQWIPIDAATAGPLGCSWWLPSWRASGWIVVAQKEP